MVRITGDTHGNFGPLWHRLKELGHDENDTIIILGDVALNYHGNWKDYNTKKGVMKRIPGNVFAIRGNHDLRPEQVLVFPHQHNDKRVVDLILAGQYVPYAHYEEFFGNTVIVEDRFPRIKYPVDGNIYTIDGHKCLVIGGGYSVDKWYRLENGWVWNPQEMLSPAEMETIFKTYQENKVDCILSHVGPSLFDPYIKHLWMGGNEWGTIDHSMEDWMNSFLWHDPNEIKMWYFGHNHANINVGPIGVMLYDTVIPFGEKAPVMYTEENDRR